MSDSKVIMFPEMGAAGSSSSNLDPNLLLALNQNGGLNGGNWMWIIFLFFLFPLLRNGGFWGNNGGNGNGNCCGFGPLAGMINNNDGRQLLDAAINRNGSAIDKLASMFGCGKDAIIGAINGVQQSISNTGASIADVKYAMSMGNQQIGQQLAQCCCDVRESITRGNYENQLQTVNQTNVLQQAINGVGVGQERGFSSVAYETQRQTCEVKNTIKDLGTQITSQFGDLATRALQDKVDALREANSTLKTQLNNEHQTAIIGQQIAGATTPLANALAGLSREVDSIKCKLPDTVTTPYQPFVAVPNCVAYQAFGAYPFANTGGSIWA